METLWNVTDSGGINMAPQFKRDCPICYKSGLLYLSGHLRQVHQLSREGRKPWLKSAIFSVETSPGLP